VIGKKIKIKTKTPIEERRNFMGCLKDYKEHTIFIETEGGLITLAWSDVEKANLVYEFDV